MYNTTTRNEKIFAGKLDHWFHWYLYKEGIGHYAINSLLYLPMLREKYVKLYEMITSQLWMYAKEIRILLKVTYPFFFCHHWNYKKF